ncbi:MAG: aminoacyltransferase, partial [Bacilli bacterium]|nr:aminoacyltransferase [Bacilli bacterium]
MHIIILSETQYRNYSAVHSKRNYKQTVEYASMMKNYGYDKMFLGLVDDSNNVIGATVILEKKLFGKYNYGYAPNGFLIDFDDTILLKNFTKYLKEFLKELNFIYISLDPNFAYRIYGKNNIVLKCYPNIIDNMESLGYIKKGFNSKFKKYNAILHVNDIKETYNSFNRNTKRKLQDNDIFNLDIYKENNIDKFYSMVIKKSIRNIDYYRNMLNYFNDDNTKFEIYFAKLNTDKYLDKCRNILYRERDVNSNYQDLIRDITVKKTDKLIDDKIKSDKIINKYKSK